MRKPGYILRSVSSVVVMGAWLMGCPVWDESGGDDGRPTADAGTSVDTGTTPTRCTADRDCQGGYCNTATNSCVASLPCSTPTNCRDGYTCDSRNVCVPGCSSDAQCSALGAGLVCDTATRRCAPSGRCSSNSDCAATPATPVCLGGSCQPDANRCQFDYQCTGSGQSCVDGQCIVGCTAQNAATVCAAGQVCTSGRCGYPPSGSCANGCASGQLCVSGACLATCQNDAQCGDGQRCDYGVCRVDTRPRPFCTMDSQCNAGSVCFNGACRRTCPMPGVGNDGGCMSVDVQFNLCRPYSMNRNLCTSTLEQNPECARTAECSSGRECVNARCQ
ncbi:MAG: hypothetical protein JNK72_13780 [Myxococcales bacterium]|nr:hypothetical protein [Myxococcales bacterium]